MYGFQQAAGSEQGRAVAARPAGVPPLGQEGQHGSKQGLGREGWQTRGVPEGRGAQEDPGLEGWQTKGTMEGLDTQRSAVLEGHNTAPEGRQLEEAGVFEGRQWPTKGGTAPLQHKQHQLVPVLPRQQPSDMYHVQPLPAPADTAPPGNACHAFAKAYLVMPLMSISIATVCPDCCNWHCRA